MPEHASFLTLLLHHFRETLDHNASIFGQSVVGHVDPTWASFEPISAALVVALLLLVVAAVVGPRLANLDEAVVPEARLTLRTFVEAFLGYFYDMAKSVMGEKRAKQYYGIIGTSALFVFFSNILALLPGFPVATSSLSITLGCALVVFLAFNAYGIMANGWGYFAHLAGPAWYLAWLLFPIEVISLLVRPVTLAVRLMLNMSVDHILLGIFLGLVSLIVPLPVMLLGTIVILVQTLVFALLTSVYIGLATDSSSHHESAHHEHGHGDPTRPEPVRH